MSPLRIEKGGILLGLGVSSRMKVGQHAAPHGQLLSPTWEAPLSEPTMLTLLGILGAMDTLSHSPSLQPCPASFSSPTEPGLTRVSSSFPLLSTVCLSLPLPLLLPTPWGML